MWEKWPAAGDPEGAVHGPDLDDQGFKYGIAGTMAVEPDLLLSPAHELEEGSDLDEPGEGFEAYPDLVEGAGPPGPNLPQASPLHDLFEDPFPSFPEPKPGEFPLPDPAGPEPPEMGWPPDPFLPGAPTP